jgi:hypothetical protein
MIYFGIELLSATVLHSHKATGMSAISNHLQLPGIKHLHLPM